MTNSSSLSERELEVLRLLATGASNKEIAAELLISVNTVKVHLRNIYGKLDVSSRTEATIYAVREGLIPSPRPESEPEAPPLPTGVAVPQAAPQISTWGHWGKWAATAAILLVMLLVAGLLGAQWVQRRTPVAPQLVDAETFEQERWQQRASMQVPRASFAASVVNNQIYALGGETDSGLTATAERYDIAGDQWTFVSEMPEPLVDIQGATIGGKIYVPGGRRVDGGISDDLLIYDPRSDAWDTLTPMPQPLSAYALVAFEGKLYLFGGWDGEQFTDLALRYDPSLDAWATLPAMPTARGYAGAAVSGGKIHVVGGYDGEQALDVHEVYVPGGGDSAAWDTLSPLPVARYSLTCVSVAEIVHALGGEASSQDGFAYRYLLQDDSWQPFLTPVDDSWGGASSVLVGEQIYIFGGQVGEHLAGQLHIYQAIYAVMLPVLP